MIVVHVLCIFIMLDFIKKAMIKIKVMTTYNPNILHVQTYCVFSLYQLRALILCLIINVLLNMLGIFKIALGSKYLNFFLTYKQLNCKNCSNLELTPIKYFESVMWILICQLLHFVNWMQIFEWKAMIRIKKCHKVVVRIEAVRLREIFSLIVPDIVYSIVFVFQINGTKFSRIDCNFVNIYYSVFSD